MGQWRAAGEYRRIAARGRGTDVGEHECCVSGLRVGVELNPRRACVLQKRGCGLGYGGGGGGEGGGGDGSGKGGGEEVGGGRR